MRYIVDANQMKAIDRYSIEQIGIPSMVLMENAARAVVRVMRKRIQKTDRILAVCGAGNNGGDGIAVARILSGLGYQADILFTGELAKMTAQTKLQYSIAGNLGIKIFNNLDFSEYNVIVDAMFGIGLSNEVSGIYETAINRINQSNAVIFAVDIPSGVCSNTGKILKAAVRSDETITFGYEKIGLLLYPGCEYAGKVTAAEIGFPEKARDTVRLSRYIYDESDLNKLPVRPNYSNKGTFGRVLIIAGSKNMCGACFLSAKAAYRSGAGLVKILTIEENRTAVLSLLPEVLLSTYDPEHFSLSSEAASILNELTWATAVVIGPGLGRKEPMGELVHFVLQNTKVPLVVDADAVNLLAEEEEFRKERGNMDYGRNVNLSSNVILTPHLKEMSGIMNLKVNEIADNLLSVAEWAVRHQEYTLVLKDARTIVSDKNKTYINTSGNNGMATGGTGDVLTGIIAAFLAQGMNNFDAAALGVYVHGLAADAAVIEKGVYSLVASDIIEALPKVLNK